MRAFIHSASALFGTLVTLVIAHSPAKVPGIIVNSYLPRGFNGTVHSLAPDIGHNVYASCLDPFDTEAESAFIVKLDSKLHTVWSKKFVTFPHIPGTIAFSDTMGLYWIIPMKNSETDSIHIWVLEMDVADGKTMQALQIDSVTSIAETGIKAFVATSERERPTVYVSYVEQRISQGDTVTKVFKIQKMDSSVLLEQWRTELHNASEIVVSHEIAEYLPDEGLYVAQITREPTATTTERVSITLIHANGSSTLIGSFASMTGNAKIAAFESDDNGVMYLSESPSYLHHLAMISLNGSYMVAELWSDSSFDIRAMHVLRNGSLLYALANSEVTRNRTGSMVSENVPVFIVYNYTGDVLLTDKHNETNSGVERHLRTFAMRNEAEGPAIVLGGYFRLVGNDERPGNAQISLGTYVYWVSAYRARETVVSSPEPELTDPEEDSAETRSRYRRFAIGISCGVSIVIVTVGIVTCLRRRSSFVAKLRRDSRSERYAADAVTGVCSRQ
ncbi:hypothetical protein FGB62_5g244 [Gracilaria domingensis]|nr:hypothetical protein FGB62_5g244 [Gracilaria domingensis]